MHPVDHFCDVQIPYKTFVKCISTNADLYVPDRQSQTKDLGELRSAILAETIKPDRVFSELGDIIIGKAKGRNNSNSITIADLTGTGVQDTVISTLALKKATLINSGSDFIS